MAFTHDFIINIDSIDISGEVSFNNGEPARVKFNSGMDLPLNELRILERFFGQLNNIFCSCGAITEIKIRVKP